MAQFAGAAGVFAMTGTWFYDLGCGTLKTMVEA